MAVEAVPGQWLSHLIPALPAPTGAERGIRSSVAGVPRRYGHWSCGATTETRSDMTPQVQLLDVKDYEFVTLISIGAARLDYMIIDKVKRIANSAKNMSFNKSIVLDFGRVEAISSMIMGSLVDLMRQLRELGQKLVLVGMNQNVRYAFANTRLDQLIDILPDVQTAMKLLSRPAR
jgi:anti-anti-sigma factor